MKITSYFAKVFLAIEGQPFAPQDCAVSSGSFGGVAYRYYAIGPNCAPKSHVGTIEGALHSELMRLETEGMISTSHCVHFDPDGGWDGWVLFGRLGEVNLAEYCGPSTFAKDEKDEI